MKLLTVLTALGVACVAALLFRWPWSMGTGLVVVMHAVAFLLFAALWLLSRDRKRQAALGAAAAVLVGLGGAWAYFGPQRPLVLASGPELAGAYRFSRAEGQLELTLQPDGTFTHALVEPAAVRRCCTAPAPRVQRGRWSVSRDPARPRSTVAFDDYGPACVVPDEQCELARYMGQALASGLHEVAQVCRVGGRLALCFNESDEYVRR